ncbi:MAG: hypothetical protein ACD_79C00066G0003 [uncultured bacterium]|nr:MAG: hypothetical protein ACD_79C00066G0003 [uncultured bacterium]
MKNITPYMLYKDIMNENNDSYNFGNKLLLLRKKRGLSQSELGNKVGLSRRMIIYYEKHTTRIPNIGLLKKFANALNCPIDHFFEQSEKIEVNRKNEKLWKKFKKVENFTEEQQKAVLVVVETIAKSNKQENP